jgi:hypothetical protein
MKMNTTGILSGNLNLSGVSSSILNVVVIILAVLVIGGIAVGVVFAYLKNKKYSAFKCIIWEKDAFGQVVQSVDEAGIFVDGATNNKRLFLKRANVGLSPDNIPYITTLAGKKIVFLARVGLKNYNYIKPNFEDGKISFTVGEEDVNWAINAYERQKKAFGSNMLLQYMPYILMAFVSIVILVIFIYFFKSFSVLKDVALAFQEASKNLILAKGGSVV